MEKRLTLFSILLLSVIRTQLFRRTIWLFMTKLWRSPVSLGVKFISSTTEKEVCSYPKCRKPGHLQAQCLKKRNDQLIAKLKRGREEQREKRFSRGSRREENKTEEKSNSGCYCCGSKDHRAYVRPDRADGEVTAQIFRVKEEW